MPTPYAHDHSPPAGERDSPGLYPGDGGRGPTRPGCGEYSSAVPGMPDRFGRRVVLHSDADRPVRRADPGWPLHEMRPLNGRATDKHSKGGMK